MKKFLEEILLNLKGKVHNYGFWVSLISAIIMLLQMLGIKIAEPNDIVGGICSIFVVLGIISNPNSGKGYLDKDENINNTQNVESLQKIEGTQKVYNTQNFESSQKVDSTQNVEDVQKTNNDQKIESGQNLQNSNANKPCSIAKTDININENPIIEIAINTKKENANKNEGKTTKTVKDAEKTSNFSKN